MILRSLALLGMLALAACTQGNVPKAVQPKVKAPTPHVVMNRMVKSMDACWYRAKDPALKNTRMAPELNSLSGKPRVLLVPRNNPAGLPKMVIQAETIRGKTELTTFGPLVGSKDGPRLVKAVRAWARGETVCA